MRRRKALPLYDRRWVLLTEAHAEHAKRIVSGVRAAREYIELLRNGGIRSMLQRDYPERYYGPPAPVRLSCPSFTGRFTNQCILAAGRCAYILAR